MKTRTEYDVIIVGGGMVGSALACALAQIPLRVLIAESAPKEKFDRDDYDLRVSAITRASQALFERVGAWSEMVNRRVFAYEGMHVWDATGTGEIQFDAAELGEPSLGHMIENRVIQAALIARAEQNPLIDIVYGAKPTAISIEDECAEIAIGDKVYRARLIVGADGAQSWVRSQMGVNTRGWGYGQKGIVTTVTTEHSHQNTAWQRFLPTGPLAFLPLADKVCSIVWSASETQADALMQLNEVAFLAELNQAIGDSPLGRIQSIAKRAAFPLRLQHALEYTRPRIVLVGDAAHTIHPLAGQGVNLGFSDVIELIAQVRDAVSQKRDIGNHLLLRRYERARKGDNIAMMALMDGFKRLFGNDVKPLVLLRNMGLNLANHSGPIKRAMVRHAMGLDQQSIYR